MLPSGDVENDKKDTPGIATAVRNQLINKKPSLMRRLQYYSETKKEYEMNDEIREINVYLDVMKDERMVKKHGVAKLQSFLSKICDMDKKHRIPEDWIPKTPTPPRSAAYDEELSTTFSSRPSRRPLRRDQHNNRNERRGVPGNKNRREFDLSRSRERRQFHRHAPAVAGSGSTTTRERSESGGRRREWDEEQDPQRSRSRSRAERRTQRQPSIELSDWVQDDDNSRESGSWEAPRYDDRESHWLKDSRPQYSGHRESIPPAHSFHVNNSPPQPHFSSGSANNYMPGYPYAAPIFNIENIGLNCSTYFFNAPPPSLNQLPNNVSRNHIRERSRSPIRPTPYRPGSGFSARPETQRMKPARNYEGEHSNRTARALPIRDHVIPSASTNPQERNRKSRSDGVRQRIQKEVRNEGCHKLEQREKKLDKGSSTDKPNAAASSGSAAREAIGGQNEKKKLDRTREGEEIDTQLERNTNTREIDEEVGSSERNKEVESGKGNGKVRASQKRREAELRETNEELAANKMRNEGKTSESQPVAGTTKGYKQIKGMQEIYKKMREEGLLPLFKKVMEETEDEQREVASGERNGESVEATENETQNEVESNQELNGEMSNDISTNDINGNGLLLEKPAPTEVQLENNSTLEIDVNVDVGAQQNIIEPVALNENGQQELATSNHDEHSGSHSFPIENELENSQNGQLEAQGSNYNSKAGRKTYSSPPESESTRRYNFRNLKRKSQGSAKKLPVDSKKSEKPGGKRSSKSNAPTRTQPGRSSETAEEIQIRNIWKKSLKKFKAFDKGYVPPQGIFESESDSEYEEDDYDRIARHCQDDLARQVDPDYNPNEDISDDD